MSKQEANRLAEHIRIDQDWCEEAAALLRQWPEGEPVASEYYWLVEHFLGDGTGNSTGHYHTEFSPVPFESHSTKDPYKAKRFSARAEAESVAAQLGATLSGTWRAVEHGFHAPSDSAASIAELEAQRDALLAERKLQQEVLVETRAVLKVAGEALSSIARNTCCDGCQEAARVAQASLQRIKEAQHG